MLLLNCTRCDDVVQLGNKVRVYECGLTRGKLDSDGSVDALGSVRVFTVSWRVYDGLGEGSEGAIGVLPRAQFRAKGGA